ncbi:hypothetical protein [Methylorubrum suomiense]|uniref:Uncharacterized protein n=1 Tax=Methylorubrum suomiense TaxID=144191 RepID=A0ABQ4UUA1_9HYPH|nr:hypothetical protein [Methylorubrum suomiense]GJE74964.1 hypothetical protein BGCPKDLD_1538 [Methylorubrum suomiense]
MPWTRRRIEPLRPPVGPNGYTYNPNLVVQTSRVADARDFATDPIWQVASLTKEGRAAVLRPAGGICGPALLRGWRVRKLGAAEHCALVLRVDHFLNGGLVSVSPEWVAMEYNDRMLVVTPELVVGVRGAYEDVAFGALGDIFVGTHPRKRRRIRHRGRADDLEALAGLAPG